MTSLFPGGIDPAIVSAPGQTLDQADHTNLHVNLSSGMNKVQTFLGAPPTGTEPAKTMRQRLVDVETNLGLAQPILTVAADSVAHTSTASAVWVGGSTRSLTLHIPRGVPGTNGTNGKDGTGAAATGLVNVTSLYPIKAGGVVGVDVSFGKDLGFLPKVVCTPEQWTVGTKPGVTTTSFKTNTAPTAAQRATYQGDGVKRTGTEATAGVIWHGQYDATNGHQHGIYCFNDLFKKELAGKGATITKIEVKFTVANIGGTLSADQLTVHQSNLTAPPATHLNSAVTGAHTIFTKSLVEGSTYTMVLPASWHAGFMSGAITALIFGPERTSTGSISNSVEHFGAIDGTKIFVTVYYSTTTPGTPIEVDSIPVDVGVRKVTQTGFRLIVRNSSSQDENVKVAWVALL